MLDLKLLAKALPLLRSVEKDAPETAAWFLRLIFDKDSPSLLIKTLPFREQRWIIKPKSIPKKVSSQELNQMIEDEGRTLDDFPPYEEYYYEDDFFDRVASATDHSTYWLVRRIDNVVPIKPRPT